MYIGRAVRATSLQNHKKRCIHLCSWTTSSYAQKCKKTEDSDTSKTSRTYSQEMGMEIGIEKCDMLIMKSGKKKQ